MNIALTHVNYASKTKHVRPKREGLVFCLLSVFLLLCLLISPAAAAVEWEISPSNPTVGDTLKIKGTASPCESLIAGISFEKEIPVSGGRYEYLLENIKVPEGKDNRFIVRAEGVQNLNVNVQKWIWIKLHSDASSEGVATISQANVPSLTYNILIDGDAGDVRCETSSMNLIFTASQTLEADSKGKFKYSYDTSSIPEGEFTIKIGDSVKTIELRSKEQKKPVSEFSASPTSGKVPLNVSFTDLSKGEPTSWKWSFGDGTYSTEQNPVHTYNKAGTYTVSLKVKNADGSDETIKCSYITVLAPLNPPVAKFSASPVSGKVPLKVSFTDLSTGEPTSWKWRFGDGTYSTNQNPVHTYNKAGTYTVSLKVKNTGGTDTETRSYIIVSKRK
ncbi:cell surface protein [Methanosarcina lacustris Z-7289]|uniref:Cell surface protein n=1 Tax=Methanosarcina lacustris Z-7289 TaxID=1434111 RepID=A0A0E3S571_9EURY|nr:cell surface protein [Methanosarcina lacustris Z-7289]